MKKSLPGSSKCCLASPQMPCPGTSMFSSRSLRWTSAIRPARPKTSQRLPREQKTTAASPLPISPCCRQSSWPNDVAASPRFAKIEDSRKQQNVATCFAIPRLREAMEKLGHAARHRGQHVLAKSTRHRGRAYTRSPEKNFRRVG